MGLFATNKQAIKQPQFSQITLPPVLRASLPTITLLLFMATTGSIAVGQPHRRPLPKMPPTEPMVHDPVVAQAPDGTYYMLSTGRGLQVATSTDLQEWHVSREPFISHIPSWTHDSVPNFRDHIWAPDIIHYNGRWWIAYSCSTFGVNTSAIGLLSSPELSTTTQWTDEGPLICSREGRDPFNAIDPAFITDGDNTPWMVFGSFWDGIQLVRLNPATMHVDPTIPITTIARRYPNPTGEEKAEAKPADARYADKENPIEAPFIYYHDGYYYLFVSWDYCCRQEQSTYKVAVGRSTSVSGPYLDKDGNDMAHGGGTLLLEGDKTHYYAAGHCSAYHFASADHFFCHGYNATYDGISTLIHLLLQWQDGWPSLEQYPPL